MDGVEDKEGYRVALEEVDVQNAVVGGMHLTLQKCITYLFVELQNVI